MDKGVLRTVTDLAARQKKEDQSGDSGPTFDVFYFKAPANKEVNTNNYYQCVFIAKVRSKQIHLIKICFNHIYSSLPTQLSQVILIAPVTCKLKLWQIYVDDVMKELTYHLSSIDTTCSITFTYEEESDKSLPFLDIRMI